MVAPNVTATLVSFLLNSSLMTSQGTDGGASEEGASSDSPATSEPSLHGTITILPNLINLTLSHGDGNVSSILLRTTTPMPTPPPWDAFSPATPKPWRPTPPAVPPPLQTWIPPTAPPNTPDPLGEGSSMEWDDATWILLCCFFIFTMQTGFAQLEAGCVQAKNEVNIIMKNALDIVFGGVSFWMFGYGLAFGMDGYSNPFSGVGYFFVEVGEDKMGTVYLHFLFQLSFCTTATTIVSGAMAERTKLTSYVVFSFFNTIVYSFPAHWIWDESGFLHQLGAMDFAGACAVHLVGGVSGLVATLMLGPRRGRFDDPSKKHQLGKPADVLFGTFTLWWGWMGFNCGSTFGVKNDRWKLATKAAIATMTSSMGGGVVATIYSYVWKKRKFDVDDFVVGVLASLVAITGVCPLAQPWEGLVIGAVGGLLAVLATPLVERMRIDDPVGVLPVHGIAAIWGVLAVGLFAEEDHIKNLTQGRRGLFKGGGAYLLGVQLLAVVSVIVWTLMASYILLQGIETTLGLRMPEDEEILGSDWVEHGIRHAELHYPFDLDISSSNPPSRAGDDPEQQPPQDLNHSRCAACLFRLRRHFSRQTREGDTGIEVGHEGPCTSDSPDPGEGSSGQSRRSRLPSVSHDNVVRSLSNLSQGSSVLEVGRASRTSSIASLEREVEHKRRQSQC